MPDGARRSYHQQWILMLRKINGFDEAYARLGVGLITTGLPASTDHGVSTIMLC